MSLDKYIRNRGFAGCFEGFSAQVSEQVDFLANLSEKEEINTILEIGFNAGHGSNIFLRHGNNKVTSFDIGNHEYILIAKEYIDLVYPYRHLLFLGDSKRKIPLFSRNNAGITFDLIFIDGGHDYDTAIADLKNCKHLSHSQTIVVMDDVIKNPDGQTGFNKGPTKAWEEMLKDSEVVELGCVVSSIPHRGFTWGKYCL